MIVLGIKHNATVKHFFEEGSLSGDISVITRFKSMQMLSSQKSLWFYRNDKSCLKNKAYKEGYEYNPEFINTVGSHILIAESSC